jgi:hypothetical protein
VNVEEEIGGEVKEGNLGNLACPLKFFSFFLTA